MCRSRVTYKFFILPIVSLSVIVEGCAVFGAIGDAMSSGYENTVTYFNLYYNARSAFRDAEAQIVAAEKAAHGKILQTGKQQAIPADAQKNLDLVIDKCSNILAYHSSSSFVDGALMLIGKAFYYRADYSKAERKFLELITQYPGSSGYLEAQLWYAKSRKELGEYADAMKTAEALIGLLEKQGENDILSQAYSLVAALNVHDNASAAAIDSYEKAISAAESDHLKGQAWANVCQLYFNGGEYQKAVDASARVEEYADDDYLIYQSKVVAADSYRLLQLYDKALALTNEIIEDYRFRDYLGSSLLERADILRMSGRPADAFELYRKLDTTYVRTEAGARASFELAKFYETSAGDYARAREYYTRASSVPGLPLTVDANRKVAALNSYFSFKKELATADSISLLLARKNTTLPGTKLSDGAVNDTIRKVDTAGFSRRAATDSVTADTLDRARARASSGLGELFYTDMANPDSAFFWLTYSLSKKYEAPSAPRILYILEELAKTYPDKSSISAKEYREQLIRDFADSYFARQLQNSATDTLARERSAGAAEAAYDSAEALLEAGKNGEAIAALRGIIKNFGSSALAAKSQYALGWIYENKTTSMDSAAAAYRTLLAEYPSSPYALAVRGRMLDTLSTVSVRADSAARRSQPQTAKDDSVRVQQVRLPIQGAKPGATLSRRARILQSMNQQKIERDR